LQRSRDEFFSIASHELRTPLTAIRGNTSLIKQYFPDVLKDDNVHEMIDDIHDSSVRLIEIVNDFLDASRLEQDKMKLVRQPFTIEPLVEKVIYEMASLSRDKGIALTFDQETLGEIPQVYGDMNRVKQILYNLIGNAMKFTKQGSVTINCLIQGRRLKVTVTDTGPGISPEGQQLLFHKFQQTAQSIITRDDTRGTGLGLYISKLLVEHMGGEIRLEHSEVGKGSTFSFTLPFATAAQIKAGAPTDTGNEAVGPAKSPQAGATAAPAADQPGN
jgi:signal transduction histidine kinase